MTKARLFTLAASGFLFTGMPLRAQQTREPLPDAPPLAAAIEPTTAPLEERIATAQSVKVMDSILGIALGSELDEAHEKLDSLSAPGKPPRSEGGEEEEKAQEEKAKDADERTPGATEGNTRLSDAKTRPGTDGDEGRKVLWQLAGTDYSAVYIVADDEERITSITGIFRSGKEMPFDKVGEVAKAPVHDNRAVVWDVLRPGRPLHRVLAKGADGKASTLTLFVVARKSIGALLHPVGTGGDKAN